METTRCISLPVAVLQESNPCRAMYGVRDEPGSPFQARASKRRVAVRFVPKQARRCQPRQGQAASRSECSFEPTLALCYLQEDACTHSRALRLHRANITGSPLALVCTRAV